MSRPHTFHGRDGNRPCNCGWDADHGDREVTTIELPAAREGVEVSTYDDWKADVANREGSAPDGDAEDPNDAWEAGYDQAAREVLEEVKREDLRLYLKLLARFPGWRTVMRPLHIAQSV